MLDWVGLDRFVRLALSLQSDTRRGNVRDKLLEVFRSTIGTALSLFLIRVCGQSTSNAREDKDDNSALVVVTVVVGCFRRAERRRRQGCAKNETRTARKSRPMTEIRSRIG